MERIFREKPVKKNRGGKDLPECENCGRPVKLTSDDYTREEILCPSCAAELDSYEAEDYDER